MASVASVKRPKNYVPTTSKTRARLPKTIVTKPKHGRVLYFAFGANMAKRVSEGVRRIYPAISVPVKLFNYKLCFQHIGGYATIVYRPDDKTRPDVHGVLMDISSEEMQRLIDTEGGYDVIDVVVTSEAGDMYKGQAFASNWSAKLFEETKPTIDYITKLREGALEYGLPASYQEWLNDVEGRQAPIDRGTLDSPASIIAAGFCTILFGSVVGFLISPKQ